MNTTRTRFLLAIKSGTHPRFLKESLPRSFTGRVAGRPQKRNIHKGRCSKHDGLIQQQTNLTTRAISGIDRGQKVVQLHQRHVGVNIFDVRLQQCILQRQTGERQGPLGTEELNILCHNLGR